MADGTRPGGLTALAVLNFVFGGLGALGLLALIALLGVAEAATDGEMSEAMAESPQGSMLAIMLILSLASTTLLIMSGVGYLGQKRFLGRTMGNAYAVTSIVGALVGLSSQPFGITTMIGLIYPVLTLVLINTTFSDDLVN